MVLEEEIRGDAEKASKDVCNLLERFQTSEKPTQEEVLNLLDDPNTLRYFKFNISQYCELLLLAISHTQTPIELNTFLKHENTFQKTLKYKEEFSCKFLEIVLQSVIQKCDDFKEDKDLFNAAAETISICIFSSKEFTCYLNDHFDHVKCPEKHSICKSLFKFCVSLDFEVSKTAFKLIFFSFSNYCWEFTLAYKMLIVLLEVIGFEMREKFNFSKIKYLVSEPSLCNSLEILNELLSATADLKRNLNAEVNSTSFFDFIKNVTISVMSLSVVPNSDCYGILLSVIKINPLIIESIINETLVYIMLSDKTNYKKEYENVMVKILEVFSKLHRIQNLIAKMIPTLKSALENKNSIETIYLFRGATDLRTNTNFSYNVKEILPPTVQEYFTECITDLASWQIINLFKSLIFHLTKATEELEQNKGECIYIEILGGLTCWLLMSVRIAEHTVAATTVQKFLGGLEELKVILRKFGATLLQREHNQLLMRAFLKICYDWAEIYMTLEYYSVKNEIKMEKNTDNNVSACNITYLHPYLSEKEWYLISERINNFGEKPCKEIMQKLMIQKLRAFLIFNENNAEDVINAVVKSLSTDFDTDSLDILINNFVVTHILDKMPTSIILNLSEVVFRDLAENNTELIQRPHIYDSQLLTKGILCIIFAKINKLLKQKRKHDDAAVRKALFSQAFASLPQDIFLQNDVSDFFPKITEVLNANDKSVVDIKVHRSKIELYLDILTKIPAIFCPKNVQKLVILLLMTLRRDFCNNNEESLKEKSEAIILSMVQHNRFTLLELFEPAVLIKNCINNFDRSEELFAVIIQSAFKTDELIQKFEPGITYVTENLKQSKCLRFAVILLHLLVKVKKSKLSSETKAICAKYKSVISTKVAQRILKNGPEDLFIEAYALILKNSLAQEESDAASTTSKLKTNLDEYLEYCLSHANERNIKGCLLLFTTILHNKNVLTINDTVILRIWDTMKSVTMKNVSLEEYSQLVMLVTTLIPNEQFSNIFKDLLQATTNSIGSGDNKEFGKHLKTWTCISFTNFNSTKTTILREQLEFLLEQLLLVLKSTGCKEELFQEVIQFEISIIQATHVPLTASIMDFLLLSVPTILMQKSHDFIHCFNLAISLLENLLKYRNPLIMDRLPPYLLQYRLLLKELCALKLDEEQKVSDCGHKMEKLTKNLVDCTKDMSRIAMYLIADILGQYELYTLYPNLKNHLNNCLYSLFSLCDQHAVQYLMRVLSEASTEMFKVMYKNYKKYYRFTGKV